MRRRELICFLGCGLVCPCVALAQLRAKQKKIGWLSPLWRIDAATNLQAFHKNLEHLGHVEGRDIAIEFSHANGNFDRLGSLAAELVEQKVDIIVAYSTPAAVAARKATGTIPIVAISVDPVGRGLVESLARPGGNVTGLTFSVGLDLFTKSMDLLKQAVPELQMVALLVNPANPFHAAAASQIEAVAQALNVRGNVFQVRRSEEIATAFEAIAQAHCGAVFVVADALLLGSEAAWIAILSLKYQLPSMHQVRAEAEAGGLMSYGPDLTDLHRRAATYVDAILKGAKPADLPVQQPTKFELVINLSTARALGLTIPLTLLVRADELIK